MTVPGVAAMVMTGVPGAAAGVVNVASAPLTVSVPLVPTSRKWYVVDGARPSISPETDLDAFPLAVALVVLLP